MPALLAVASKRRRRIPSSCRVVMRLPAVEGSDRGERHLQRMGAEGVQQQRPPTGAATGSNSQPTLTEPSPQCNVGVEGGCRLFRSWAGDQSALRRVTSHQPSIPKKEEVGLYQSRSEKAEERRRCAAATEFSHFFALAASNDSRGVTGLSVNERTALTPYSNSPWQSTAYATPSSTPRLAPSPQSPPYRIRSMSLSDDPGTTPPNTKARDTKPR